MVWPAFQAQHSSTHNFCINACLIFISSKMKYRLGRNAVNIVIIFSVSVLVVNVLGGKGKGSTATGGSTSILKVTNDRLQSNAGKTEVQSASKELPDEDGGNNEVQGDQDPSVERINDATFTTASLLSQLIHNNNNKHKGDDDTVQYLDRITNPGEVAQELESAAKYLMRQEEIVNSTKKSVSGTGIEGSRPNDKSADLVGVLDGFVFFNNLYDALVRPGQFNGRSTTVTVDATVSPWLEINEAKNEFTASLTLTQNWTDDRLAYHSRLRQPDKLPYVTLTNHMHSSSVEFWLPDTFIMNEKRSYKHGVTVVNDLVRIMPNGEVSREQRITVTAHCPFYKNFKSFPFDSPVCFLNLTSFSWSKNHLIYKWLSQLPPTDFRLESEANGFFLKSVEFLRREFKREDFKKPGEPSISSGLVIEFHLRRNLSPFITKLYLPLASFSLIAIVGLMSPIGPEIGSALSYFMFGLQSIFMAINYNTPDLNWGNARTALDSYYIFSVFTIMLTGIANILKLKRKSSTTFDVSGAEESFEMHGNSCDVLSSRATTSAATSSRSQTTANNITVIKNCVITDREARLWKDSDNFIDDNDLVEDYDHEHDHDHLRINSVGTTGPDGKHSSTKLTGFILFSLKSVKRSFLKLKKGLTKFCYKLNQFSIWLILLIFVFWNLFYWLGNL